ncbi:MAG: DUF1178 family protein [Betaproteobacteria bacterium]|nr:DUF1178 family protein [Betaproteobacteria bacterium]
MIVYDLVCDAGHRFEGWFHSAEDFDAQTQANGLRCAVCGSAAVRKVPGGTYLPHGAGCPDPLPAPAAGQAGSAEAASLMERVVRYLVANSEDVGRQFPEEARRIYYEDVEARAIRGTASRAEIEALKDEGIEVLALPTETPRTTH